MPHLTKTETSLMAEYCHNSCSKCPHFARTHAQRRPRHSSIAWSGQCHAKHAENAAL